MSAYVMCYFILFLFIFPSVSATGKVTTDPQFPLFSVISLSAGSVCSFFFFFFNCSFKAN